MHENAGTDADFFHLNACTLEIVPTFKLQQFAGRAETDISSVTETDCSDADIYQRYHLGSASCQIVIEIGL